MATFAPPSASRTAAARPIPRDAPVTSATLFSKSFGIRAHIAERAQGSAWQACQLPDDRTILCCAERRIGRTGDPVVGEGCWKGGGEGCSKGGGDAGVDG